ncbi:MAG: MFS transporter [Acidobacteriota bacterium]
MNLFLSFRLSLMMFLEFFVWGAWYVTVGNYMSRIGMAEQIYWAYTVSPIAAILSPFFLGMVADRFFATEKVLGVMHLLGGVAILCAPLAAEGASPSSTLFVLLLGVHMLCYMPTLGLANSLAFHHIADQQRQFPLIRLFGTLGWIVATVLVSRLLHADETSLPLYTAGIAGLLLGIYSWTLPHTPAPAAGEEVSVRKIVGLDALARLQSRPFNVFVASSLLICVPLAAYYAYAPVFVNASSVADPAFKMSFGQMSEVLFLLIMPLLFIRLGVKWMLLLGMSAWVLRYALFAVAAPQGVLWMILGGIVLHGICYDFFFVAGQIYVDKKSTPAIRGQAQGFLVLITYGVGMLIGTQVSGWVFNGFLAGGAEALTLAQWRSFWILPSAFAGAVMLFFGLFFRDTVSPSGASASGVIESPAVEDGP